MSKHLIVVTVLIVMFSACAPQQTPTELPSIIIEQPGGIDSPEILTPVESAVVDQLAGNLGLNTSDISVIENKSVEFPDGCLGISMQDVMCAQVITPGRIVSLEADGIQYEYHTSEDGSQIQPAKIALIWSRDGGFAGFCDRLTIFLSGEVYGNQCSPSDGRMSTFAALLSRQDQEKFFTWIKNYGALTLDASDPKGVADGMSLVLDLSGMGEAKPSKSAEQEIFIWAQELFQKLYNSEIK